jgi:superfamily II DNA or RNA helicase
LLLAEVGGVLTPGERLMTLSKEGVLVIFDEAHNLKKAATLQYKAAFAISKFIHQERRGGGRSRVMYLSATPSDTTESREGFLHLLSISTSSLFHTEAKRHKYMYSNKRIILCPEAQRDITEAIGSLYPEKSQEEIDSLLPTSKLTKEERDKRLALIYNLARERLMLEMKTPEFYSEMLEIRNSFYLVDGIVRDNIKAALLRLSKALKVRDDTNSLGAINLALLNLQLAKYPIIVRESIRYLEANVRGKVVIFGNYNKVLDSICEELEGYGVAFLNGKVPIAKREKIIALFNEDSDICRVMVANTAVGGVGIDLDDKEGSRPRRAFIYPDYRFIPCSQAPGRVCRSSTKSKVIVSYVYCSEMVEGKNIRMLREINILRNLRAKVETLSDMCPSDKSFMAPKD